MVCFDREREAAQPLGGTSGQRAAWLVRRRRCRALETGHRLVDLHTHARPALLVVRLGLRQDEITGELRRRHGGQHRSLPVGGPSLTTRALR